MRLIDADALIVATENFCDGYKVHWTDKKVLAWIDHAPTIDAEPVKYGRWRLEKNGKGTCDQCHFTQLNVWDYDNWQRYCGCCGAKMEDAYSDG